MWTFASVSGRVKQYQGFTPWEAALVPAGTFLALSEVAHNLPGFPASLKPSSLDAQLDADAAQAIVQSVVDELSAGVRKVGRPAKRYMAGIVPLTGMRLPMGIFVPQSAAEDILASSNTTRRKVAASMRKVVRRLQTDVAAVSLKRRSFVYKRAFNGLAPLEAVYIPRGYYIPLTSLSSGLSSGRSRYSSLSAMAPPQHSAKALVNFNSLSAIKPLDVVPLPGGIFVPHRMNGYPDLPSEIVPVKPTGQSYIGGFRHGKLHCDLRFEFRSSEL